ncbi:MAG: glycosyltransferase family 4 protein [Coleofasciculus sp. G1-WW12-02]|uniref:glycosyltransferase family 4 protein n=1 Tax=Coleofasciculus sp. G1-WW12-02 TaxID=3068483 RepID=UPI0032FBD909
MRLLIVQHAGDYREAAQRLAEGGAETYYAQKYSVNTIAEIAKRVEDVTVLCFCTATAYNQVLPNGVRAIGAGFQRQLNTKHLINIIEAQNPNHLILRTSLPHILKCVVNKKIRTLAIFAESFQRKTLRKRAKYYFLSRLLNQNPIEWIANHNLNSCLSLQQIGVNPEKIIPWDWPPVITPESFPEKRLRRHEPPWHLLYVGILSEAKGIGDTLEAIAYLKAQGLSIKLKIAGIGETEYFVKKAETRQIQDSVDFLGLVSHHEVMQLMKNADLIIIPSRHTYPEGLPMTLYEALCTRTPIVASDHPMFNQVLQHQSNALIFPSGNSLALAACIETLVANPELYQTLSTAASATWERLQIPVKWGDLIQRWLNNSPDDRQWLFDHRLASGRYNSYPPVEQ